MTFNKRPALRRCGQKPTVTHTHTQSDRGEGSVEEALPWPQKMASPPELQETGDSAPAGCRLAPFGNERARVGLGTFTNERGKKKVMMCARRHSQWSH